MPRPSASRTQRAFSLVEIVIALAVAAILAGIAAPSFRALIEANARESAVYDLLGDLQFARSEAIKRGARVTVCAARADDPERCGQGWGNGRLTFVDDAAPAVGGAVGDVDAGETVLRRSGPTGAALDIAARARPAANAAGASAVGFVRFGPRGTSDWRGGGHFRLRPAACEPTEIDALIVTMSGDVRRARRDATGAPVGAFGAALACP